jgi:surface antigen
MTEREIPDGLGFLFGGMTDDSQPVSAPPASRAPQNPLAAAAAQAPVVAPVAPAHVVAPVYASRREARAAAGRPMDAAAPATAPPPDAFSGPAPSGPAYDGVASLFPLLADAGLSPVDSRMPAPSAFDAILAQSPADLATRAMPVAEVAAELSTPVPRYVVPQSGPVPIIPAPAAPAAPPSAPASAAPATPVAPPPSWHSANAVAFGDSAPEVDPFVAARSSQRAAPAKQTGRQKKRSRSKRVPHEQADRHAWARGERAKNSSHGTPNRKAGRNVDRKSIRQRIFGVGVMVAVGGLFAVLAIPAYADNDAATLTAAAAVQTQKLSVEQAAASSVTTSSRDGYTATSAADLKRLYANAIRQRNLAAYLQSGAMAQGDDYPWFAELSRNQGGGLSPLSYYYRECVDFVAWRLNRDVGSTRAPFVWTWNTLTPSGGNASQWKSAWLHHGWPTGTTPQVGAVAWFSYNHVAYVSGILNNGQVLIEEYNQEGNHLYDTRIINAGDAYYLYAPPR